jgi:hypothetical protein
MRKRISSKTPTRLFVAGAALVIVSATSPYTLSGAVGTESGIEAAQGPGNAPGQQKKYRATRPIVSDKQTGQWRMPTADEVAEVVTNLATLTNRSDAGLPETQVADAGVAIDLASGFAGVLLARPNEDGTLETKCVFTFEEAAEFLGLVEDAQ